MNRPQAVYIQVAANRADKDPGDPDMDVLEHTTNAFNGIVISPESLPSDMETFSHRLSMSLEIWKKGGYQLVWLEVPISKSEFIPVAVQAGFSFHHSGEAYLLLTRPLVDDAFIPGFATHYIGAGGVVISEKNEILVVCEKHRGSSRPYYKLPGGALHPGEHLAEAAVREIREETGVRTSFEAMVCFRHWHGYRHDKSDIYFVCRLKPLSYEIIPQPEEIEECLWMPVEEYLTSDYVHTFNRQIVRAALSSPGVVLSEVDGYSDGRRREIFMPPGMDRD